MSIAFLKRIKFLKKKKYKPVSIEIISKNIIKLITLFFQESQIVDFLKKRTFVLIMSCLGNE